jgi:Contact-dependent growth inhibition CdiA C-terminal domain
MRKDGWNWVDWNVEGLRKAQDKPGAMFSYTSESAVEKAKIAGQAVSRLRTYEAETFDKNQAGVENETNQKFVDQGKVLWNTGVNNVESAINFGIDLIRFDNGRNPAAMIDPLRPRVNLSGIKPDYQSEMMRRDINGKLDGDGLKRGRFTEGVVTILAPLVVGKVTTPIKAPNTLKSLGALPEVEANALKTIARTEVITPKVVEPRVSQPLRARPSETVPSSKQPIGSIGTPEKIPTKITTSKVSEQARGLRRQNEAAEIMSKNGYHVEYQPKITETERMSKFPWFEEGRKPDFKIEGEIFDGYSPNKSTSIQNVIKSVKKKTENNQARRILINLDDSNVSIPNLAKELRLSKLPLLDEVIVIKHGKITKIYPYNQSK